MCSLTNSDISCKINLCSKANKCARGGSLRLYQSRLNPINESLLIQCEIYFHERVWLVVYEIYVHTRTILVDECVTETRIKYAVTVRDQSVHEPLFSLDPTEGFSPAAFPPCSGRCVTCELLYIHRDVVYVAIELSHSPLRDTWSIWILTVRSTT